MRRFSFLIVEDETETLNLLTSLLAKRFPQSRLDCALTAAAGRDLIMRRSKHSYAYDAAILDFQLPETEGALETIDETLCQLIRDRMQGTKIAHITGHIGDETVNAHVVRVHSQRKDPRAIIISKGDLDWADRLVHEMQTYLYGDEIERALADVFGVGTGHGRPATRGGGHRSGRGCMTSDIIDLTCDIAECWHSLDEHTRSLVKSVFEVDGSQQPARVSLL